MFGCEKKKKRRRNGMVVGLCRDCLLGWWCLIADWTLEAGGDVRLGGLAANMKLPTSHGW